MRMRQITALLIPVLFLISGCEKQPDYREKYLGNWNFEIQSITIKDPGPSPGVVTNPYTTYRKGEIKLGEGGNEIILQFEGIQFPDTLSIDPGGKIIPIIFNPRPSITYSYTGGFEGNNKLQYIYNYSHSIQTNIHKKVIGDRE
jgi:hypothetical protein